MLPNIRDRQGEINCYQADVILAKDGHRVEILGPLTIGYVANLNRQGGSRIVLQGIGVEMVNSCSEDFLEVSDDLRRDHAEYWQREATLSR